MGDKIIIDKYPPLARFRARELTHAGAATHFLGVHLEKGAGGY